MQKLGIGYEDYKEFTDQNMYYVDKTLLIRDVLKGSGKERGKISFYDDADSECRGLFHI